MISSFDFQPTLMGQQVSLRAMQATDFPRLQAVAQNLNTWADYPNEAVKQTGSLEAWFSMGVENAKALLIQNTDSDAIIGTTRYYSVPNDHKGIGIGYTFLDANSRNGGATNKELKALMFSHAFESVDTIWFHVLPNNLRSQAAVKKLGVKEHGIQNLHLTDRPFDYVTFSVSKNDWQSR